MSAKRIAGSPSSWLLAAFLLLLPLTVFSAPTGGNVVRGAADIKQSGTTTNVNQSTDKAVINWRTFSIAPAETVNFNQPSSRSMTLNRVTGNERSLIEGALNANGKVFLVNSAGITITKGASINTAGLVASTLDIADDDFMNGKYTFKGNNSGLGEVVNMGRIEVAEGGYVALLGDQVRNEGVIVAKRGTVAMNGAEKATLNFNGDSLVSVSIEEGSLNALVENKNAIVADGGKVILTAKGADEVMGAQVNTDGIVQARTLADITGEEPLKGSIEVNALGGTANIAGTLDASAPDGGDGGFIETSGKTVKIADSANITTKSAKGKTGTWLIDPENYTIAASGGNMTGKQFSDALVSNNFEINAANGDINIDDEITWVDTMLKLIASNDININAPITITGPSGVLAMEFGGDYNIRTKASYAGTELVDGSPVAIQDTSGGVYGKIIFTNSSNNNGLKINGQTYTLIHNIAQLDALDGDAGSTPVSGYYAIANDMAGGTFNKNSLISEFTGTLTGIGNDITGLTIVGTSNDITGFAGIIGEAKAQSVLRDINLVNAKAVLKMYNAGSDFSGTLVGKATSTTISNIYLSGEISASGGIAGLINTSNMSNVLVKADVVDYGYAGIVSRANSSNLSYVSFIGRVISHDAIQGQGGLVGTVLTGYINISNSYFLWPNASSGKKLTTTEDYSETGKIENIDILSGSGLVGLLYITGGNTATIENSFVLANIAAESHNSYGGLVGQLNPQETDCQFVLDSSYFYGDIHNYVTTTSTAVGATIGGLIGYVKASTLPTPGITTLSINNSDVIGSIEHDGTVTKGGVGGIIGAFTEHNNIQSDANIINNVDVKIDITAKNVAYVGGLIGLSALAQINSVSVEGTVHGGTRVGGLIGHQIPYTTNKNSGLLTNSYFNGNVDGNSNYVGAFFGSLSGNQEITNSYWNNENLSAYVSAYSTSSPNVTGTNVSAIDAEMFADSYAKAAILKGYDPVAAYELHQEQIRQEQLRQEQLRQEQLRQEQLRQEQLRQEQLRNEAIEEASPVSVSQFNMATELTAEARKEYSSDDDERLRTTPVSLSDAIRNLDEIGQMGPNMTTTYTASIKTVVADGVTYIVDANAEPDAESGPGAGSALSGDADDADPAGLTDEEAKERARRKAARRR
ncbi:MAG: filamentous hemagglutinin N-terminal domain-containing protein [Desulfovibrio sp.]|jgi:filamentous hemagglutinin family protein|nr:filamentous hemagglutinin N-terminal domain-containing protein [Desulfovibrio sp.]